MKWESNKYGDWSIQNGKDHYLIQPQRPGYIVEKNGGLFYKGGGMTGQFIYKNLSDAKKDVMRDIRGEFNESKVQTSFRKMKSLSEVYNRLKRASLNEVSDDDIKSKFGVADTGKFTIYIKPKWGYTEVFGRVDDEGTANDVLEFIKTNASYDLDDGWVERSGDSERTMKQLDPHGEEDF